MKKIFSFLLMLMLVMSSAFAQNTRVYCKMAQSWWTADGAAVGVHYWGGSSSTQWPGERMTLVEGETDLWTAEIPSNSTGLIFVRVSGSGTVSDWGAKTADLTLPTDGKNLYTITSTNPVWGAPGVAGEWSVYTPAGTGETPEQPQDTTTTPEPPVVTLPQVDLKGINGDWAGVGMVAAEDSLTCSYTYELTAGTYEFKVWVDGAWLGNNGTMTRENCTGWLFEENTANCGLTADVAGEYKFIYEYATHKVSVVYPEAQQGNEDPEPPVVTLPQVDLKGINGDWAGVGMVAAEDSLTCSYTHTLTAGAYEFKVWVDGAWLGNNGTMTRENCTGWLFEENTANCGLTADVAGEYKFIYEYATHKVSVVYPEAQQGIEEPEEPSNVESYTIKFKDSGNNSDNSTKRTKLADIVAEGADYVASVDAASDIYQARTGLGIKFGSSSKAGSLTMTLAEPAEFDSIAITAAMYTATEGADGFTVNGTTIPLSAGDKVLERNVIQPTGVVSQLAIAQVKANKGRFYMTEITLYPKAASTNPEDTTIVTPPTPAEYEYALAVADSAIVLSKNEAAENEYMALCVEMEANAQVKLMNKQGHVWAVGLEDGVEVATATEEGIVITNAGKYDFYLKLEYGNDRFWIANAACVQGEDTIPQDTIPVVELPFDYAILATDTIALEANPSAENEYMALCVEMEANAQVKLMNKQGHVWAVGLEDGVEVATATEEGIVITNAGKYDFYLKLEYGNDRFWIATAACVQGEDTIPQDTIPVVELPFDYAILATDTIALEANPSAENEYMALCVEMEANAQVKLMNKQGHVWAVGLEDGVEVATATEEGIVITNAGKYDFYLKLEYGNDRFWIANAACVQGEDTIPQDTIPVVELPFDYAILATDTIALEANPSAENEYMALCVEMEANAQVKLMNKQGHVWAVGLEDGVEVATATEEGIVITNAGKYDFYLKLEYGNDRFWIANAACDTTSTTNPEDTTVVVPPTPEKAYYVTGASAEGNPWLNGLTWQHTAEVNKLVNGAITFAQVPAGTYEFKVTDGATEWYGYDNLEDQTNFFPASGNDKNIGFVTATTQDITVHFNAETKKISVDAVFGETPEVPVTLPQVDLKGINGDWGGVGMVAAEDSLTCSYTHTLTAGAYEFKVWVDGAWLGNNGTMTRENSIGWLFEEGTENCHLTADVDGAYTFVYEYATRLVSVYYPATGGNDTIPQDTTIVNPPTPTGDGYYVAGNGVAGNPWCNGQSWAPAAAANELHNGAITFANVPAGVYQFKVTNGTWDMSWGYADLTDQTGCEDGGGNNVKFVTSVAQDITIRFNAETQKISLEAQIGGTVEITTYTIVGEAAIVGSEWTSADASNDMTLVDGVYTLVKEGIEIAEAKDYMYKVVGNHSYDVYQYPTGMDNATLAIAEAGKYNITYTFVPETETLNAVAVKLEEPVEGLETIINGISYLNGMILNENGALVYVYSANGALVTMSRENINLNAFANGVYIIRTADNYMKVVR